MSVFIVHLGGLFPGIVLYLTSFYKRHALQLRFAMMFSVTSLAGAFSGLLAAAIQNMDGMRGLPGWAWIFVLVGTCNVLFNMQYDYSDSILTLQEGVFTTVFGLLSFLITPAKPAAMPFLTLDEKAAYIGGLQASWSGDGDDVAETFSWSEVGSVFVDAPHVFLVSIPLFFNGATVRYSSIIPLLR